MYEWGEEHEVFGMEELGWKNGHVRAGHEGGSRKINWLMSNACGV